MATANMHSSYDMAHANEVLQKLIELFGDVRDIDTIQSTARRHNYNLEQTTNALLEEHDISTNSYVNHVVNDVSNVSGSANRTLISEKSSGSFYLNAAKSTKSRNKEAPEKYEAKLSNTNLNPCNNISVNSKVLSKKEQEFHRIIQHVRQGSKILILMRGLPGSGKSYLARQIVDRTVKEYDYSLFILSTDDYFYDKRTKLFNYQSYKIQEAHEWNQHRAYNQMSAGISPVIIDNTNTQMWEMKSYSTIGANFGYAIEILEPFTPWAFDEKQLSLKNKHGVPKTKIADMHLRYEKNITPAKIFDEYKLSYINQLPPVPRNFPPIVHTITTQSSTAMEVTDSSKKLVTETIDLIGFEDAPICISDDSDNEATNIAASHNSNLIDSIMEDSDINSEILLPNSSESHTEPKNACISSSSTRQQEMDTELYVDQKNHNKIFEQIKKAKDIYPSLNLSSWGLSENAISSWESWDMVTPLTDTRTNKLFEIEASLNTPKIINKSNSSTNTSSCDFALLTNKAPKVDDVKIINTNSRDINIDTTITPPCSPPKKALLHKSSMTCDISNENNEIPNEHEELEDLRMLFSEIPFDYLRDVYEKCKKNINWTVDLLLDDNKEILPYVSDKLTVENGEKVNTTMQIFSKLETNTKPTKNEPNRSNEKVYTDLKKHIEESIEINKDFYSDHLMKIKHSKHRGGTRSRSPDLLSASTSNFDITSTRAGEVIAINSSVDINDFEADINYSLNEDSDEDQTVEINLGEACISQLDTLFGFPENFPKGFLPIVQIPHELAEQLYAFYVQSVVVQMETQSSVLDTIMKEDEELAKKLQMQEDEENARKIPDLNEIMKEQVADKVYRKEVDEWKKLTPDTLAAKLTIQKLVNSFPSVDRGTLQEILHAHNNSYKETVEVLLNSTSQNSICDPDGTIREPPISETTLSDMRMANEEKILVENIEDVPKSANEYRDEANDYYGRHNDYMQKAQRAFQSKQYAVAQFYSSLAKSYTQMYEQTNSMAATAFLNEHSNKLQHFQTLDLHYLYVKEALPALDMFLDRNIRLLNDTNKNKEALFVITGRGKRSGGKSRLKPAVMGHLKKRGFKFAVLNPGLLKVTVYANSSLSGNQH